MVLDVYGMHWRPVVHDDMTVTFTARVIAHTDCCAQAVPELKHAGEDANSVQVGPNMTVVSKGFDGGWDGACPFCQGTCDEGFELIFRTH